MPASIPVNAPEKLRRSLPHRLWGRLPPVLRRQAFAHATGWLAPKPHRGSIATARAPSGGDLSGAPVAERRVRDIGAMGAADGILPNVALASAGTDRAAGHRLDRSLPGIIVAGEFTRASGVGETARLMAEAARSLGVPTWTIDVPSLLDARPVLPADLPADLPPGAPLVLHTNPPMLPLALMRLPRAMLRDRPIIGYWAWELPEIPPEWRPALACVNRIWVPSRFTAAALESALPGRVTVVPPPLGHVPPVPEAAVGRAAFGLPEDAVVVLVSFSLASAFARKNPFAAVAAFRGAFGDRLDRILVLKIGHAEHAPKDFSRLAGMARAANIRIETRTLAPDMRHALTACADIVLSLHRAEGFGLVLAEAMLLGKPVVATGWSGNTDFMNDRNAVLVGYRLAPARDDRAVYRGLWAEPDVAEAAERLRHLADDAALRRRIGERARTSALHSLGAGRFIAALKQAVPMPTRAASPAGDLGTELCTLAATPGAMEAGS